MFGKNKSHIPGPDEALPGRATEMPVPAKHFVNGHPLKAPFPEGLEMEHGAATAADVTVLFITNKPFDIHYR